MPNQLATELNEIIGRDNPNVFGMFSELAKELRFLPFKTYFRVASVSLFCESRGKAFRLHATAPGEFRGACSAEQNSPENGPRDHTPF